MISISLLETPILRCKKKLFPNIVSSRKTLQRAILGFALCALNFAAFSQTISISSPVSAVVEGSSPVMSFTVELDNGAINTTGGSITGIITWTGTATNGFDYTGTSTFAIANGASSIGILVPLLDDAICEPSETATATISNVSSGSVNPTANSATVTIIDDDCGTILISIGSPVDATENPSGSSISFVVEIIAGGPAAVPITGTISYMGSAIDGSDYSGVAANSYTIPAGQLSTTISIPVIDDFIVEPTETVVATLTGSPSIGTYANTTSTANIFDDDAANLSLSIGSPVDGTEGSTFVSYIVSLDNGTVNSTGSPITGSLTYTGTATALVDYVEVTTFSIPDGASSAFVILMVIDDALVECNETVIATISSPNVGVINPTAASSTANIIDDECAQVSVSIGSPVDGGEGLNDASFTVSLDNGAVNNSGSAIVGTVSFAGTATASFDYSNSGTFSIPDGASSTVLAIVVIDDLSFECDETVEATISTVSIGAIGTASSTAIIVDNECALTTISIVSPTDGMEAPSSTDASFVITLDNGFINGTGADITGTVSYSGTATPGADFIDMSSFSIPDGASFTTLSLVVIDDTLRECDESIVATISNPSAATIAIATDSAMIIDDECDLSVISLNDNGLQVYPNPVSSEVNFSAEIQMERYTIIDVNGRVIGSGRIEAKEFKVSTDFISAGSYIIEVQFENGNMARKKILKE